MQSAAKHFDSVLIIERGPGRNSLDGKIPLAQSLPLPGTLPLRTQNSEPPLQTRKPASTKKTEKTVLFSCFYLNPPGAHGELLIRKPFRWSAPGPGKSQPCLFRSADHAFESSGSFLHPRRLMKSRAGCSSPRLLAPLIIPVMRLYALMFRQKGSFSSESFGQHSTRS